MKPDRLLFGLFGLLGLVALVLPARAAASPSRSGQDTPEDRVFLLDYAAISKARRGGRALEAANRFEALVADHPNSRYAQRALASAGAIRQWDLDEIDHARELYDRVLEGPDERPGIMPSLAARLGLERDAGGPRAELALIEKLDRRRPNASYAPYLLIRAAEILAGDLDAPKAALAPLERLRISFPRSTRADKGMMREASILRRLGQPNDALKLYRAIMEKERTSFIVGEYNSSELDDAYFEMAETYRLDLHDFDRAEAAYLVLVNHQQRSRYVDRALFEASRLASLRGRSVKAAEYMDRIAALRPHSRYLRK